MRTRPDNDAPDEFGVRLSDPDNSRSNYETLLESIERHAWSAEAQRTYLIDEGYPTCELHNQFFDCVGAFAEFVRSRGLISRADLRLIKGFESFPLGKCEEPWSDERDGLEDERWNLIRPRAAARLLGLPPACSVRVR